MVKFLRNYLFSKVATEIYILTMNESFSVPASSPTQIITYAIVFSVKVPSVDYFSNI